jgi:hypothetical protein
MGRKPLKLRAMTPAERQRRSRAQRGRSPVVKAHVTEEDVVEMARHAGPEALAALWDREVDRARMAVTILSHLSAYGRTTKYVHKDFDLEKVLDAADSAIEELNGSVVFGHEE